MRPLLALFLSACVPLAAEAQVSGIRGFRAAEIPEEQKLETQGDLIPDAARLKTYLEFIAAEPHNAGSPRDKAVAQYIEGMLREWGLNPAIEQFESLLPYPTVRQVEVVDPKHFTATLKEPVVPQDRDSGEAHQLPTYNAYSASGDVRAEVVYANFGVPDDYEWLAKKGIDVKGKLVITRYGKSWRGIKPKVAAEHGAIGCLIYSDPHEDGYFQGDVYPKGALRPSEGVQRGSVLDMPLYPGDPLSPGWASEKGSKRLSISEAKTIMKIPVLPLSYADAQPILEQLGGPVVPEDWRGSLPLTYHAGPGPAEVHMRTDYDWTTKPLYDVVATIPGSDPEAQWIIVGNHYDAWVNGADDPVSGAVALLETARTLGTLYKQGWRPKRTIKIAFWDGEEFGLLGSTEWAEKHAEELKEKALVYLNSDSTGKGWIHISGSHTLEAFAVETASSIQQPHTNANLVDALLHHPKTDEESEEVNPKPEKERKFQIGALGAGSDYVAFLDYLGIASMNEGFAGQGKSGIYHSIYDSIYWYEHFSDGTFEDGKALAQYTSHAILRLADASVAPFEFTRFAATVESYLDEIQKQIPKTVQSLNLAVIRQQTNELKQNGARYDAALESAMRKDMVDEAKLRLVNQSLLRTERTLTSEHGLPNRAWYKHQIYAPGFYTGYGVKTIPGVREAVESKNWTLAQHEADVVAQCLTEMNQAVVEAANDLSGL